MRVISGKYKGKRFAPPKGFPSRPTTDMAKEALFGILDARMYFENLVVLDLFAGTGNISLEFLSRGVGQVTSIDSHPVSYRFQSKTAQEIEASNWSVLRKDVFEFVQSTGQKYDVIFADPPYDFERLEELIAAIFEANILEEDGILILEHSDRTSVSHLPNFKRVKTYGGVAFSFFEF